jgi:hypothetical protein
MTILALMRRRIEAYTEGQFAELLDAGTFVPCGPYPGFLAP